MPRAGRYARCAFQWEGRAPSRPPHPARKTSISPKSPLVLGGGMWYHNAVFLLGLCPWTESEDNMATSSITANFYTDDPKAANAIVHALFTQTSARRKRPQRNCYEVKHTPAGDRAFFERVKRSLGICQPA